ncbi:hypothetical protein KI387_019893, partial [Taxus chinensis]
MAVNSEKDVEKRLSEAGKKLEHPPQSKDELLSILEEVENCLSMVEQSPSETMQLAVCPAKNSLVKPELLRHQDKDVRLVVITCISEITRITAPETPYSDDTMREVSPAAHTLAIDVVKRCAEKLKPYLTAEMSAEGLTPSDLQKKYHEIVYEICQNAPSTLMPIVLNNDEQHLVDVNHDPVSVVGNDTQVNVQAENLHPVVKFADDDDVWKNEDKHVPEGDVNGHKDLPQKISDTSVKDEGKENLSQDIVSPALNKASKGRRSVQSRRPTGTVKVDPDKSLESKFLESGKPTVEVKEGRKNKKSEVFPEVIKGSHEGMTASDSQPTSSSKRKRRSDKNGKNLASLGEATREKGGLKSTSQSNVETEELAVTDQPNEGTAGLALPDQPNEDTVALSVTAQANKEPLGLASAAQANKETAGLVASEAQSKEDKVGVSPTLYNKEAAIMGSPDHSSKEAVGLASLAPVNKETEGLTSPAESTMVVDSFATPPRSNKDTESLTSPMRSSKDNIGSPSRTGSTKEAVALSSPARSNKEIVGMASPNEKQSLPEVDDTGTDSSRAKRGRLRSAGKRSAIKEDSKLPGLSIAATEKASEVVAGAEMAPSALPNTKEKLQLSKDLETRSKRSKRKLDVSNENTPKAAEAISLRKRDLKEMGTPDTNQEDSHRPKKMQKVASATESAEKNISQAGESSVRTPRNSAKKRSISGLEKTPTLVEGSGLDENLVGRKIKVWWPKDKQFYDGTVDSYDPKQNKHKIVYSDGDVEILNLQRQKWEFVDDNHMVDKSSKLNASPKTAGEKSAKKKTTKVEESSVKPETPKSSAKRGSQSSKSKKESRPQSDDNGAVTDTIVSKENIDEPTSESKERQQKKGEESKKGKRVASASTPTNGSARKSKGTKAVKTTSDQDQIGISSDTGARSSDDEPL